MTKLIVSFLVFLFLTIDINAQEVKQSHKDSLNSIITEYYELNLKAFQANSKVEDIDAIFKLFTSDFTYVHPKYGGTYSREDLYKGYVRNQNNGMYDGAISDIKVLNKITGLNAVVVERLYIENKDNKETEGEPQMTLFEFKDGKILRIFEYW
jgi:ketosteroid isomerase-like protein